MANPSGLIFDSAASTGLDGFHHTVNKIAVSFLTARRTVMVV